MLGGQTAIFLKGMNLREYGECAGGGGEERKGGKCCNYIIIKKIFLKKPTNTNHDNKTVEAV